MKTFSVRTTAALLGLVCASMACAQSQPAATATVPKLVRFSGSFHPANGMPAQPVEGVTLSVYSEQTGGTALWQETQNVAVDGEGKYSALMGSTQNDGVPMELFASGEPRWLGAQFNRPGEPEQPRVLMTSVPYALKSVDAETLGGKPASAYLLAPSGNLASNAVSATASGATTAPATSTSAMTNTTAVKPRLISGTMNYIPVFTDSTNDLGNSVIQQANGNVGIGTVPGAGAPTIPSLDLRTYPFAQIGMAQTTDYMSFFSSDLFGPAIYWNPAKDMRFGKGGVGLYNAFGFVEQVRIQSATGNVGIGTINPTSALHVVGDANVTGSFRYQGNLILGVPGGLLTQNIALGLQALQNNSTGVGNVASGYKALFTNQSGSYNTASGYSALAANLSTNYNTAVGYNALAANVNAFNTAVGAQALFVNAAGTNNTAVGFQALEQNNGGGNNTSSGVQSLFSNVGGNGNIAMGYQAGYNTTGNNNIDIGHVGVGGESNIIRIGTFATQTAFYAAGANANLGGDLNAVGVVIDTTTGQLGVTSSSRRYKEDIADMGEASRGLMDLRPVTYRYKQPSADGSKPIQYGLIAEEVAEVYPDLVAHSADGRIETVKYQVLDSMLLNEVQRQQSEIRGLEQQNRSLQERLEKLETALTSLAGAATSGASRAGSVPAIAAPAIP